MYKKEVAVYTRIREGGADGQLKAIQTKADELGVTIEYYYEDIGYSGLDSSRPKLQELISSITSGEVNMVIVYDVSRISRNLSDLMEFTSLCKNHDVELVTVIGEIPDMSKLEYKILGD